MDPRLIHTVTVLSDKHPGRQRTWGYFFSLEEAEQTVLDNGTNLFENRYYNLAVIETMPPGISPRASEVRWYRSTYPHPPGAQRIEPPEAFQQVINFGMG